MCGWGCNFFDTPSAQQIYVHSYSVYVCTYANVVVAFSPTLLQSSKTSAVPVYEHTYASTTVPMLDTRGHM